MSTPEFRELHLGDTSDDDPQVLDSLVQQQANPVPPIPDVLTSEVVERPKRITRMQSGRLTIQSTWQPVRVLPPDTFRISLFIAMDSADPTDTVLIADTSDNAMTGGSIFQANPLPLRDHTGAVWAYNPTAHSVSISYWAVTA